MLKGGRSCDKKTRRERDAGRRRRRKIMSSYREMGGWEREGMKIHCLGMCFILCS